MVSIENLVKRYDDYELNISMEIPTGSVVGLVGRNGAGKSTTIKAILGLIKPDAGNVKVFDTPARDLKTDQKEMIGVTLSDSGFNSSFTTKDIKNILKKTYVDFDEDGFEKSCKKNGLSMDKTIKDMSTGTKAKLKILIALSHKAKLLVLDEPTAGLDVVARNNILDMLRDYLAKDEERTILISSHISSDLEGLCDDIYMIDDGKVILHEDTDTILSQFATLKLSKAQYEEIDKQYILCSKEESMGVICLTNQKSYYAENYPSYVIENGCIDDLIVMLNGGNK